MKKVAGLILLWAAVWGLSPAGEEIRAEEESDSGSLSGGGSAAVASAYVWRGSEINSEGVCQPEVWLSFRGLGVSIWGNLDLTARNQERGDLNEVDYTAFYDFETDFVNGSLMYIYYDYPLHDAEKTQEAGLKLSTGEIGGGFSLGLEAYYDFDLVKGTYLKPSASFDLAFDPFTVTPSLGLGWGSENANDYNFSVARDSLVDLEATLEVTAELEGGWYLSLLGAYYTLVDGKLRDATGDAKDGVWGGGKLGFEF